MDYSIIWFVIKLNMYRRICLSQLHFMLLLQPGLLADLGM